MPKVSIIVAAYNVESYIQKCLTSILNSTLKDIQVIVIDDGSTDATANRIKSIGNKNYEYYYKSNGGLSDARNFGLQFARGEYIHFVDGDDFVEPDMYEVLYAVAKRENADLVECEYFKDFDTKVIVKEHDDPFLDKIRFCVAFQWNKIIRAELLLQSSIRFKKGLLYEDINFNLKFASIVKRYVHVKVPLYHYVQRDTSIMHTVSNRVFDYYKVIEDAVSFYKESGVYDVYHDDIEYIAMRNMLLSSIPVSIKRYDKENGTEYFKNHYAYCLSLFPCWKKNKYLKHRVKINTVLRLINLKTYNVFIFLLAKIIQS